MKFYSHKKWLCRVWYKRGYTTIEQKNLQLPKNIDRESTSIIATLGSILDSQSTWESGKFQLARWSHEVVLFPERTIHPSTHPPTHPTISIVTTPTTTSTQPNLTTIEVGFETIMTLHHHPTTNHTTETFRPVLDIVQGWDFICKFRKPK